MSKVHNIVYEIPIADLSNIAYDLIDAAEKKKIVITPNQDDCIRTYLHRSGLLSWFAQNIQGPYQVCVMQGAAHYDYYHTPSVNPGKPWWKPGVQSPSSNRMMAPQTCPFSDTIPIILRFEDPSDAMLFKMTYLEGS